jgi:hypothetical protein
VPKALSGFSGKGRRIHALAAQQGTDFARQGAAVGSGLDAPLASVGEEQPPSTRHDFGLGKLFAACIAALD